MRYALSTIGVIVALGFIALLFREVTTHQTVIEPISVPKSLADQGLTPDVAARRLQDAMNGLVLNALNSGGDKVQISYGKDLPEIVVPTVGMSLSTLAAYVRMFLHLSSRSTISGEIVASDKNANLVLRLSAAEIYRSDQSVALDRLDELWTAAAEAVLRHTSPYHIALCWYDTKPGEAVALAHYLIRYYPPTDESVAWSYIILGRHHRDYLRFEKARDAYKAALNVAAISRWGPLKWLPLSVSFVDIPSYVSVAQLGLGTTLLDQGEFKAAVDALNEAVRMDPVDPAARHYLGAARMMLNPKKDVTGDFVEANRLLKKAIYESDRQGGGGRGEVAAHISLGNALRQQLEKGADDEFKQAMSLDPDNLEARTGYCQVLFEEEQRGSGFGSFNNNFDSCVSAFQSFQKKSGDFTSHTWVAAFFLEKGRRPDAIQVIVNALKNDPDRPQLHAFLGNVYAQRNDWDQAVQELSRAIELAPEASANLSDLGNVYYQKGDFAEATRLYSQAIKSNPGNSRYHASRGAALMKQGLRAEAEAEYQQAFKLAGRSDTELNNLGNAFYDKDDFANAEKAHRAAIAIDDGAVVYHDALAKALRKLEKLDAAIKECEKAIELESTNELPPNAGRRNDLGDLYYDKRDFTKAVEAFGKAIAIEPVRALYHDNRAAALRGLNQFDEAIREDEEAIKLAPTSAWRHHFLGNRLTEKKDFTKAVEAYRKAIAIEPNNGSYRTSLARTLQTLEQFDDAANEYRELIKIEPTKATHHDNLGDLLFGNKDFINAEKSYRKATEMEPENSTYHSDLGTALRELKRFDAAIKECQRAIELTPAHIAGHNCLGSTLYESGDFANATQAFREAVKLEPADAQSHYYLGVALSQLDPESGEALEEYRTAIKLDPNYAEPYYLLAAALADRGTEAEKKQACQVYREGARIEPSTSRFNDGIARTCE